MKNKTFTMLSHWNLEVRFTLTNVLMHVFLAGLLSKKTDLLLKQRLYCSLAPRTGQGIR